MTMKKKSNKLPIELKPEHITNAEKGFILRGTASRYLRTFKKHLTKHATLSHFLVDLCESTDLPGTIVNENQYILINYSVLTTHFKSKKLPSSRGTIDTRLKELLALDLADIHTATFESANANRTYNKQLYVFHTPLEIEARLAELEEELQSQEEPPKRREIIKVNQRLKQTFESDNLLLPVEILNSLEARDQRTIVLLKNWMTLGRSWRISSNHNDPTEPVRLFLGKGRNVDVTIVANELSGTAVQDDQKLIAILLNYCARSIRYQRSLDNEVRNHFIVDVADICKLLASWDAQLQPEFKEMSKAEQAAFIRKRKRDRSTGGYRKVVIRGLYRLHFTSHLMRLDNSEKSNEIRKILGLLPGINTYSTRFLTECNAQDAQVDKGNFEPKWFRISLDEMSYKTLTDGFDSPDTLTILGHKELLVSGSGILILLYNLVNAHVGRSAKFGDKEVDYSIDQLHKQLAPNSNPPEFDTYFNTAIQSLFKNTSTG